MAQTRQAGRSREPRATPISRREQDLQLAVVRYLEVAKPEAVWFHVPNGGGRSPREGAIFKGLGVRAGAPDLVFLGRVRSVCIELKAPGGQLSAVQGRFAADCAALGITYEVCSTVEHVHNVLRAWGLVGDRVHFGAERRPYAEAE